MTTNVTFSFDSWRHLPPPSIASKGYTIVELQMSQHPFALNQTSLASWRKRCIVFGFLVLFASQTPLTCAHKYWITFFFFFCNKFRYDILWHFCREANVRDIEFTFPTMQHNPFVSDANLKAWQRMRMALKCTISTHRISSKKKSMGEYHLKSQVHENNPNFSLSICLNTACKASFLQKHSLFPQL